MYPRGAIEFENPKNGQWFKVKNQDLKSFLEFPSERVGEHGSS